ncbi:hypothetical protein [Azospirillum sp. SYSU D00513]|uniref:DUF4376 domain-containing protein n=1 Tax=Azospirillum sp. SYSU D00513 TaxID=2812561 RepID=UPI001A95C64F|nr:hypothetical protein [Azospirillum sp. SYSU D00513]
MWARIQDGACAEFTTTDPAGRFHPDVLWAEVPQSLRPWVDTNYLCGEAGTITPPSLAYIKDQAKALLVARRWKEETAGALLPGGGRVPSQDRDKTMLGGAREKALEEVEEAIAAALAAGRTAEEGRAEGLAITHTLDMGGVPFSATNGQFILMARAQANHVQGCFDRWGDIWRALDAAPTWEDVVTVYAAEIDKGWPGHVVPTPPAEPEPEPEEPAPEDPPPEPAEPETA